MGSLTAKRKSWFHNLSERYREVDEHLLGPSGHGRSNHPASAHRFAHGLVAFRAEWVKDTWVERPLIDRLLPRYLSPTDAKGIRIEAGPGQVEALDKSAMG